MAAGSIVIDLLMRTGSFTTDTKRAAKELERFKKEAVDTGKVIGTALAAGAITAAYAFDKLVKGAAEFKDLEETTGASAEDLASLAVAAETAGVGIDALAGNAVRLTKSLTGVDDDSKAAGAAIQALGLNLAEFQALDPVARIDALTKAFAGFADGQEKTAVATALFGKQGAEMLKVFKALEEQGGRTKILTQEQIEQADAYADAQAKASAELKLYAQAAATQGAPAFLALTNAASDFIKELIGVDKETGKLGQSTAVKDFADGAVKAIAFVIDAGDGAVRVFKGIGLAIGAAGAAAVAVASGEFKQAKAIVGQLVADLDEIASRQFFSDRVAARLSGSAPASAAPDSRPRINYRGAEKSAKVKADIDQVTKSIQALEEELALFGQDDAFSKAFKLEGLGATTKQVEEYRAKLQELEALKTAEAINETINSLVEQRDAIGLTNEQLTVQKLILQGASESQIRYAQSVLDATNAAREQQEAIEEGKRVFEQTRTPTEQFESELEKLNDLLRRGAIDWNTYARAVFAAQDKFDNATKKVEEVTDTFARKFADRSQEFLGQGIYDAIKGNYKNIGDAFADMVTRMVAEAAAADLAKTLFGDLIKGGEGKGIFSSLLDSFKGAVGGGGNDSGGGNFFSNLLSSVGSYFGGARANGGDVQAGQAYIVGERRPELFVPRTSGTILPSVPTGRAGGGTYNFGGINVNSGGAMDRAAEDRAALRIARKASMLIERRTA